MNATRRPWITGTVDSNETRYFQPIWSEGRCVGIVYGEVNHKWTDEHRANAHLIVTACNNFEAMVEVLNDPRLDPPYGDVSREVDYHWFADFVLWRQEARALLDKVKGV